MICNFLSQRHFVINCLETLLIKVIFHDKGLLKGAKSQVGGLGELWVVLVLGAGHPILVENAAFLDDVFLVAVWQKVV